MIIVKLMGGLGNQMFQYAAGRCLSHLHNTELKLDLSFLNADTQNKYTKRDFALDVFNVNSSFATGEDIRRFNPLERGKITRTLMRKLPILYSKLIANESGHAFMKEFYSYPKDVYLNGYWQSEYYFEPVQEILRKEFTLKEAPGGVNAELAERIRNSNSVSLHIRRGDYVNNQEVNKFHGTCSLEYYRQAIEFLKAKGDIELFVFSDDIQWAKENLEADKINFVAQNNPGYIDMHLMSVCKHNIIANSSFSWWGAWLNPNPTKVVVAPLKWFAAPGPHTPDIYPKNWVKI
jgi:hypothetical protein